VGPETLDQHVGSPIRHQVGPETLDLHVGSLTDYQVDQQSPDNQHGGPSSIQPQVDHPAVDDRHTQLAIPEVHQQLARDQRAALVPDAATAAARNVEIVIGRIEVRAAVPAKRQEPRTQTTPLHAQRPRPSVSLTDYLSRRSRIEPR
jgi:hypothetical protein